MRKITNLLTLLLLAICSIGASAETATLTYSNIQVYKGGNLVTPTANYTYNHQVRSTTTPLITISIGTGDVVYNTSKFCFGNNNRTYTIAIDGNYVITGFRLNYTTGSGVRFTSNGVESNDDGQLAVSGIMTASTTFLATWINGVGSSGSWQNYSVTSIEVDYEQPNTDWNYTYTQYDAVSFTSLGLPTTETVQGTSAGYILTPPAVDGYAFLGAADATTFAEIDLSGPITNNKVALIYSPILQNLDNASLKNAYTITTPRGYIYAESADATQFTRNASGKASFTNAFHLWSIVESNGNKYLYNIGAKKFASYSSNKSHDLVTSLPATLGAESSTYKDGYPLVLTFTNAAGTKAWMNMNADGVMIDNWSSHDEGNVCQMVEIPASYSIGSYTIDAYTVSFTNAAGDLTAVYVDGTEVALNTPVLLTSAATVSNSTSVNSIKTYNGFSTLKEALEDASFNGTVEVALAQNVHNVTINVMRGSKVVKTVTVTDVPEGTPVDVASVVGTPSYVTDFTPATITGTTEDQTVNVTYTSTLPFELSADPTDATTSTAYLMTLRSKYTDGNATVSSNVANVDLADNGYYWTFGGNEWDGVTVYNRGEAGYMSVENADNSVATFGATPVAFTVAANGEGFSLRPVGTTAYLNERSSRISTWNTTLGATDAGSCLKVYSIDEAVAGLVSSLEPYFTYAGCANALTKAAATNLQSSYEALVAAPTYSDYLALKATIEASLVPVTEGYYFVVSAMDAFMTQQSASKSMYYDTSTNTMRWSSLGATAAEVLKLVAGSEASKYNLYVPLIDSYLASKTGAIGETALDFQVLAAKPGAVVLAYNPEGGNDAAIHCLGHNSGAGVSGGLTNWTTSADASMWRLIPVDIEEITLVAPEGVADGADVVQGFATATDAQLPLNVAVYTITEETGVGAHLETIGSSKVAGGQGYIIGGRKGATVPLLPTAAVEVPTDNILKAGDGSLVTGGYILAYKKGESDAKFWNIIGLTIPADRSYLPEGTPTAGLENIFGGLGDDITGISGVTTGNENSAIYDLQGRRVSKATKGVYIIGGKKVIK